MTCLERARIKLEDFRINSERQVIGIRMYPDTYLNLVYDVQKLESVKSFSGGRDVKRVFGLPIYINSTIKVDEFGFRLAVR